MRLISSFSFDCQCDWNVRKGSSKLCSNQSLSPGFFHGCHDRKSVTMDGIMKGWQRNKEKWYQSKTRTSFPSFFRTKFVFSFITMRQEFEAKILLRLAECSDSFLMMSLMMLVGWVIFGPQLGTLLWISSVSTMGRTDSTDDVISMMMQCSKGGKNKRTAFHMMSFFSHV